MTVTDKSEKICNTPYANALVKICKSNSYDYILCTVATRELKFIQPSG